MGGKFFRKSVARELQKFSPHNGRKNFPPIWGENFSDFEFPPILPFTAKIFPPYGGKILSVVAKIFPPYGGKENHLATTFCRSGGKFGNHDFYFPPIVVAFSPHMGGKQLCTDDSIHGNQSVESIQNCIGVMSGSCLINRRARFCVPCRIRLSRLETSTELSQSPQIIFRMSKTII